MTEVFILQYAPLRLAELGHQTYHFRHRDLVIGGGEKVMISAYNELFFIVEEPPGLIVDSDYGMYDSTDNPIEESVHIHRGEISIYNPGVERRRIKFIQAVIVN